MNISSIRMNIKNVGLPHTLADVGLRAANRVALLRVLKAIRIESVDPKFLDADPAYKGMFLDRATLRHFAADPSNELTYGFIDEALGKGDECYGFVCGEELAAYGWYSNKPTPLDFKGLHLRFDPDYVYMYKGFTSPRHRGQRLHAIGMTRALQEYLLRGYRGIISYVEWNNFASLKSCYRMGYTDVGNVAIMGMRGHYMLRHDAACAQHGFRVVRSAEVR